MIDLVIEDYCQNCRYFEPEKNVVVTESFTLDRQAFITVTCEHADQCRMLKNHIERSINDKNR